MDYEAKKQLEKLVKEHFEEVLKRKISPVPGKDYLQVGGHYYDEQELLNGIYSVIAGDWAFGRYGLEFEKKFSDYLRIKHVKVTTSGSSANLLAVRSLRSHLLKEKALKKGDEIITTASTFPTTVNPIISADCVPVFLDIKTDTLNVNTDLLEEAITDKTKAMIFAHTLGNPFNLKKVKEIADKHGLVFIEDTCDALGSKFNGEMAGSFGELSTYSFYPAHHITMGEGGAIATNKDIIAKIIMSLRDWGRECVCLPGHDNTCGGRFQKKCGSLPIGYDHKYVYSHIGYNLKPTEMQSAIGLAQLDKLESFVKIRRENFATLYALLKEFEDYLILPKSEKGAEPAWFGFPMTVRKNAGFKKKELTDFLEANKIGTRPLFCGNVVRQPYFIDYKVKHRIVGDLKNTDHTMENSLWVGVHPRFRKEHMEYIYSIFEKFFKEKRKP
ncbi:MAG: lipopolysaccharide biosynthesis protein RfbH [archaeon]